MGARREPDTPPTSKSGRCRSRAPGAVAHCRSANISDTGGAHYRGLCGGRRRGHRRASHGPVALGAAWPAIPSKTAQAQTAISPPRRLFARPRMVIRCSWSMPRMRAARPSTTISASILSATSRPLERSSVPQIVVVNPLLPTKTIAEFIAYTKANPGKINMASGGNGAPEHMAGELFILMTGVNMLHVPYRGAAPALTDLIAGQVQVMFAAMPASIEYIRAHAARARGNDYDSSGGIARYPDRGRFRAELRGEPMVRHRRSTWYIVRGHRQTQQGNQCRPRRSQAEGPICRLGGMLLPGAPAGFGKIIADETEKCGRVIRGGNIKAE